MADIDDVLSAIKSLALSTLYPTGIPGSNLSPVSGCAVTVISGYAPANDLDAIAATLGATTPRTIVAIYAPPGMWRNTTRFTRRWVHQSSQTATIAAAVDVTGTIVTLSGTITAGQNVGLIIGYGANRPKAFVYTLQAGDTLNTAATNLAAIVNASTPASASGAAITISQAHSLVARIGTVSTAVLPLMQQTDRTWIDVWAPSDALRNAVASPLKQIIAATSRLTLADATTARIITRGDANDDNAQKAGLYRRCLMYDVEYSTTQTMQAPVAIAPEATLQGGMPNIIGFTETDPPVVTIEA